ncbi:hypothetical protein ANTQUA_LOCUS2283 [Anthophora quadrimaculata]
MRYKKTEILGQTENKISRFIHKGVPQGTVFSPLLYNLYVNNITKELPPTVKISQYANDICLVTTNKSIQEAKQEIEKGVETIRRNLLQCGLELSPTKCEIIAITNPSMPLNSISFKIVETAQSSTGKNPDINSENYTRTQIIKPGPNSPSRGQNFKVGG